MDAPEEPADAVDAQALRLFQKATEKELRGLVSDAVRYYREAYKLNDRIDHLYRQQNVPRAMEKLRSEHGKNAMHRVDDKVVRAIDVDELLRGFAHMEPQAPDPEDPEHADVGHMAVRLAHMTLAPKRPVSPLVKLPDELWVQVLSGLLAAAPEAWFSFGVTCKKHAYLAFATPGLWRQLCYEIYPRQTYEENEGLAEPDWVVARDPLACLPAYGGSWKQMLRTRPFVKFLGCYISMVNYYSEGGRAELSELWTNPVRTVTYYRYLRFYPGGQCVMALTRLEPARAVRQMLRENKLRRLLEADNRDLSKVNAADEPHKMFLGTWTLSAAGKVHVKVEQGLVPYYDFHYWFDVKHLGAVPNYGKLAWDHFYAVWKEYAGYEDREGEVVEFSLKNEADFKFLRVRSYKVTN